MLRNRVNRNNPDKQPSQPDADDGDPDAAGDTSPEPQEAPPNTASKSPGLFRRCCSVTKFLVFLVILPPILNYAALQQEKRVLVGPGILVATSSGHKLYLNCQGRGLPTVILDAPTGMSSDVWVFVQASLVKLTRVCVYDRAGLGLSEAPPSPPPSSLGQESSYHTSHTSGGKPFTLERMVDDLHTVITHPNRQPTPFILVGSELGALIGRFYAQMFESDVSALVLLDPLVETIMQEDGGVWENFWFTHLVPSFQALHLSALTGLSRIAIIFNLLKPPMREPGVPDDVMARQKHLLCNFKHMNALEAEHHFINESLSQMKVAWKIKSFPANISVTVITGNYFDEQLPSSLNKAWAKTQQHLLSHLHPGANHIVVNGADHHMLYRQPTAVVDPVRKLVLAWRKRPTMAMDK